MSQPFIGEIRLFPYNFAPKGWAFCQSQPYLTLNYCIVLEGMFPSRN